MASDLAKATQGLSLENDAFNIDDILFEQRPRKRVKQNVLELRTHLEDKFLTPTTEFSPIWLNRLQQ